MPSADPPQPSDPVDLKSQVARAVEKRDSEKSAGSTSTAIIWEPPPPEIMDSILEAFSVESLLGQGGMGAVYRGIQLSLDRPVAIKILPPHVGNDPGFSERFRREAMAMGKLVHPNIVTVHDFGMTKLGDDDLYYIVMEFIDGADLAALISQEALEIASVIQISTQICDALAFAHESDYVHRDIKPANIFITGSGQVKVGDFGLAKFRGEDSQTEMPSLTFTGIRLGTPHFMAPECVVSAENSDLRSDIYSLGVVIYQLLTGMLPKGVFPPPSQVAGNDRKLDRIVHKAMQSDPEQRYQTTEELKADLAKVSSSRRNRPLPWKTMGIVGTLLALAFITFSFYDPKENQKPGPKPSIETVNLASNWDVYENALAGNWHRNLEGEITNQGLNGTEVLRFPIDLTENFDLSVQLERISNRPNLVTLVFPIQGRALIITPFHRSSQGNFSAGISEIDGRGIFQRENPTRVAEPLFPGSTLSFSIRVRTIGYTIQVNVSREGQTLFEWTGDVARLPLYTSSLTAPGTEPETFKKELDYARARLIVRKGRAEIKSMVVDILPESAPSAEKASIREIPAGGDWADLMPRIDLIADTISGKWSENNGTIQNENSSSFTRLKLPLRVKGSYEIRLSYRHQSQNPDFHGVRLPVSRGSVGYCHHGTSSARHFAGFVDNNTMTVDRAEPPFVLPDTPQTRIIRILEQGEKLTLSAATRKGEQTKWEGLARDVALADFMVYFDAGPHDQPQIVVRRGIVTYNEIEFRLLSGKAWFLRPERD